MYDSRNNYLRMDGNWEDYQRMERKVFNHKVPLKIFSLKQVINIDLNSKMFIQSQTGRKVPTYSTIL